jgi:hypothetical protein
MLNASLSLTAQDQEKAVLSVELQDNMPNQDPPNI